MFLESNFKQEEKPISEQLAPVHTRTRCRKKQSARFLRRIQIALPFRFAAAVSAVLMTSKTQVANAVCLPASDRIVKKKNYHVIWLQSVSKIGACTTLAIEWAQIAPHRIACDL